MKTLTSFLTAAWNFIFEKSFNFVDISMFYVIWRLEYGLTDWQLWAILIPGSILSAVCRDIGDRFRTSN